MVCPQGLLHLYKDTDYPSNPSGDLLKWLLTVIQSDGEWSPEHFYTVAFQLLGFAILLILKIRIALKEVQFPDYMEPVETYHSLFNTRPQ